MIRSNCSRVLAGCARCEKGQVAPQFLRLWGIAASGPEAHPGAGGEPDSIPANVKAVEFVTVEVMEGRLSHRYRHYSGAPLQEIRNVTGEADGRVAYLLSLRAAVMP